MKKISAVSENVYEVNRLIREMLSSFSFFLDYLSGETIDLEYCENYSIALIDIRERILSIGKVNQEENGK